MKICTRLILTALTGGISALGAIADPSSTVDTSGAKQPASEPPPIVLSVRSASGKDIPYGKVYGNLDKFPVPIVQAEAEYPSELKHQGVQGAAIVRFTLSAKGETKDFSTESSQDEFAKAALAAAKRDRWTPAMKSHKRVECRIELLYTFPGPFVSP